MYEEALQGAREVMDPEYNECGSINYNLGMMFYD